jgi:hypothetical protein
MLNDVNTEKNGKTTNFDDRLENLLFEDNSGNDIINALIDGEGKI